MQDSDTHDFFNDEQFTNHSWKEMEKLLDKEMPVERKRRRGLIWFFLLAGLMLGFWLLSQNKSAVQPVVPKQPIAVTSFNNAETNVQTADNELVVGAEVDGVMPVLAVQPTRNNLSNNNNIATKTKSVLSKTSKYENRKFIVGENVVPVVAKEIANENVFKTIENVVFEEKSEVVEKPLLEFLEVPTLDLQISNSTKKLVLDFPLFGVAEAEEVKDVLPKRKTSFGVYTGGLIANTISTQPGFLAGVQLDIPLGKRWGIKTGLGYSLIRENLNYRVSSNHEILIENIDDTTGITQGVEYVGVQSEQNVTLRNLQFLDLPVLATFQAHKKWQVFAGVNTAYLLKAKFADQQNDLTLSEIATNSGFEVDQLRAEEFNFEKVAERVTFEKFHVSSVLGIGWQPNQRWNFQLSYFYELNNWWENINARQEGENFDANNYSYTYPATKSSGSCPNCLEIEKSFNKKSIPQSLRLTVRYNLFKKK